MKKEIQDTSSSSQHALEIYVDFQTKMVIETTNILTKGSALYLAILAALTGYIFTQDIEKDVKIVFVSMLVIISLLTAFSSVFVVWGIYQGIKCIEFTLGRMHESAFDRARTGEFFWRGKLVFWIVLISNFGVFLVLLSAMIVFLIGWLPLW